MINKKHKKAFSMITAIFVIIMMSTLTALIQNITGKTIKATTQQYQKEQAVILARSYTELAILYATSYDRNATNRCLQTINSLFGPTLANGGYSIKTEIRYIGRSSEIPATISCNDNSLLPATRLTTLARLNGINSFDNTMSLIIDVYIKYQSIDDPTNRTRTFHRRTLQKI